MEVSVWQALGVPTVGTLVRRLRTARGWSLTELSEKSGVRAEDIGRIEHGKQKPQARTIKKLAKAFGVDVAQLEDWSSITPDTELPAVAQKRAGGPFTPGGKEVMDAQVKEAATGAERREARMDERYLEIGPVGLELSPRQRSDLSRYARKAAEAMTEGRPFLWHITEGTG